MDLRMLGLAEGGQPTGMQRRMKQFLVDFALDYVAFRLGSTLRGHLNRFAQLEVAVALSG